tara:strand:+ start:51 stop:611 length:561 start_codon:yes stop_codon:yes gene_type:complete
MLTLNKYEEFTTPIWHLEDTPQWLVDFLYKEAYRLKENCQSDNRSNKGGYQSPPFIWEEFAVEPKKYFNELLESIPFSQSTKVQLEGEKSPYSWYNINSKGSWNVVHTHPVSSLTLILYLTDTNNELSILNPNYHTRYFLDSESHYISPKLKRGDIIIFPADLMHFVKPNESNKDRVCLSMNLQLC